MPPIPSPRRRPQTPVELPPLIDDSDAAQDRLIRKAVDEPSLKPKKEELAARDESDRLWYRQQRLKYGALVFIVVLIAGGIGWYLYDGQQKQQALLADNAAEQAEQESRMAELAKSTRQDVRRLTAALDFAEAREVLQRASAKGLSHTTSVEIDGRISSAERRHGEDLLDQAESEINSNSIKAGNALLVKVEVLTLPSDLASRVHQLRRRARELEHKTALAAERKLLDESKSAAEAGEFDRALTLLDRAKAADLPSANVHEWESQLREVVGGRVLILGQPDNALFRVDGVGEAKLGETLAGIKTGTVDVVVIADGHLPESLRMEVSFPNVTEARVRLVPEAAGPLWATAALDGHCSQVLAAGFYRSVHSGATWLPGVDKVVSRAGPCAADSVRGQSSAAEAVKNFRSQLKKEKLFIRALDKLGAFVTRNPAALETVVQTGRSDLAGILGRIERGCADCWGAGLIPCDDCKVRGKRREMRPCTSCNATGKKTHTVCKGSQKVGCHSCRGRGYKSRREKTSSGEYKDVRKSCGPCKGSGKVACKCQGGTVTCSKCKGSAQAKLLGTCSTCSGRGGTACGVCSGTGERRRMEVQQRRSLEERLARIVG